MAINPMLMTRLVGQLTGALRNLKMYPASHATSQKLFEASLQLIKEAMGSDGLLSLSLAGNILLVNDKPVPDSRKEVFANFISELGKRSVGQLAFKQGLDRDQLQGFFEIMSQDPEQVKAKGGLAAALALRGISNIVVTGISYGGGGSGAGGGGASVDNLLPDQVVAMLRSDPSMVTEMLIKGALALADTEQGQEKLMSDLDRLGNMVKVQGGGEYAAMMAGVINGLDQRSSQMVAQVKLDNPEWSDVVRELLTRYSDQELAKLIVNKAEVLALENKNDPVVLSEKLRGMVASIPVDASRKQGLLPLVKPQLQFYGLSPEDCDFVFGHDSTTQPVKEKYLADMGAKPGAEMVSGDQLRILRWIIRRDADCRPAVEGFLGLAGDADPAVRAGVLDQMFLLNQDFQAVERFDLSELLIGGLTMRLRQEIDEKLYRRAVEVVQQIAQDLKNRQRQALVNLISKEISGIMLLMAEKPVARDMVGILSVIGDEPAIRSLILALLKDPLLEQSATALAGIKERALPYLMETVKESEDSNMRFKCMYVLNKIGQGVEEQAVKALADDRWFVRRNMCVLLSLMGGTSSLGPLGAMLEDKDSRVRQEALKALFKLGGGQSESWLIRAMGDKDPEVKKQAIDYAGQVGSEASADALSELYYRRDMLGRGEAPEIKKLIINALGRLGTRTAAEVLVKMAKEKDPELARAAETALTAARRRQADTDKTPRS